MLKKRKITVDIKVPDGNSCVYYDEETGERQYTCSWVMVGAGGQKWCRMFDEARISDLVKCEACSQKCN